MKRRLKTINSANTKTAVGGGQRARMKEKSKEEEGQKGVLDIVRKRHRSSFLQEQENLEYNYAVARLEEGGNERCIDQEDDVAETTSVAAANTAAPPRIGRRRLDSSLCSEGGNQELLKALALHQAEQNAVGQQEGTTVEEAYRNDGGNQSAAAARSEPQPGAYSGEPGTDLHRNEKVRFSRVGRCGPCTLSPPSTLTSTLMTLSEETSMPQENSSNSLAVARALRASEGKSPSQLQLAEEVDSTVHGDDDTVQGRKRQLCKLRFVLVLGAVIILVSGLIILMSQIHGNDHSSTTHIAQGFQPDPDPESKLLPLLPAQTRNAINHKHGPQEAAFVWLIRDPNFQSYNNKRLRQRFALATIYFSTDYKKWDCGWHKNDTSIWLDYSKHECNWNYYMPWGEHYDTGKDHAASQYKYIEGLCHVPNTTTTAISFYANSTSANQSSALPVADDITCLPFYNVELRGTIPMEITMLTGLKVVNLEHTTMGGNIPSILLQLTGLVELHLSHSSFHGTIPTELALLTDLEVFDIDGTAFTGTLPSQLALMTNLQDLKIVETSITGAIPTEYGLLRPMDLQLYRNRLTGAIPTELGLLSTTRWLMVERNQLSGTIPTELGRLETALILYLQENQHLTGTVPTELGLLTSARQIYLHGNLLSGRIPTELGNTYEIMWRIKLNDNSLTGTIPSELGKLTKMQSLGLDGNQLTGPIPKELGDISALEYFRVHQNQLNGSVVDLFLNNTRMLNFSIGNNHFTGSIPSEVGVSWPNLDFFDVENNLITGSIPSELGQLKLMKLFRVANNGLTGTVAKELELLASNTSSLRFLDISSNPGLSGSLPEGLCVLGDPHYGHYAEFAWDCSERLCGCDCPCWNVSGV